MPQYRMGEALGLRPSRLRTFFRALTSTLPRFDPTKYGLADYSFYEGVVDFVKAQTNGVKRPIIRVGQGYYGIDRQFKTSSNNSKGLFSRDFYWMLDTKQSANGQAVACANALKAYGQMDEDSILFADFEIQGVDAAFLWGFITTLKANYPGIKVGIYSGYWFWSTYGSALSKYGFDQYKLWIAWPVDPYVSPKPLAPWGLDWYYHQFTFNGDGLFYGAQSLGVDLSYMNPAFVPTPPPPPPPVESHTLELNYGDGTTDTVVFQQNLSQTVDKATMLRLDGLAFQAPTPPPPPPPPPATSLYRILTDGELPAHYNYNGKSRTAQPDWTGGAMTPATVKLHGPDPVKNYPASAAKLVQALDMPHGTFGYVTRTAAGWSNKGQTWPDTMEPIVFEGNVVEVISVDEVHNKAYIKMWSNETDPLANPQVIHRWYNIDQDNHLNGTQNPAGDGIGYIVLAYPGTYYIELDRLVKL